MIYLQCNDNNRPTILDTIFAVEVKICYLRGYESTPALIIDPRKSDSIRHPELVGEQPSLACMLKMLRDAISTIESLQIQQS